jgi:hypothetical protein
MDSMGKPISEHKGLFVTNHFPRSSAEVDMPWLYLRPSAPKAEFRSNLRRGPEVSAATCATLDRLPRR